MQNFIMTILTCSITMSVLAILYMAVSPLLARHYSEKGRYYAWLIIVIGLIIPIRPQFNNTIVKVDIPSEATTSSIPTGNITTVVIPDINAVYAPSVPSISWWQAATAVWFLGMIAFLTYHIIKHYFFVKMTGRWSEGIEDGQILILFQSLRAEMGISKKINLYMCSSIGSPMMTGFTNPRILLPKDDLTQDGFRFILKHELVHFKRKDLLYKYLVLVATAIHWFNPIIHLMAKAIAEAGELSCDAEVVRNTDKDMRLHYTETIIGVMRYQSKLKTALSTNFYGGKRGMKKRIFSIMDTGRKKTGAAIICCMLVLTLGTGMAFAANTNKKDSLEPQDNKPNAHTVSEMNETMMPHLGVSESSSTQTSYGDAPEQTEADIARSYEIYAPFGLVRHDGELFFNGEAVRFFDDWYSLGEGMQAGRSSFNEGGTVDVYAVRDFSQIVYNADGSYDPSGKLVGVEACSQAEFDARDLSSYYTETATLAAETQLMQEGIQDAIRPYERFGVSYDEKASMMMYQGFPVREIFDEITGILVSLTAGTGFPSGDIPINAVDLTVEYKDSAMSGLRKSTKEEFDIRTRQRLNAISESISYEAVQEGTPQTGTAEDMSQTAVTTNLTSNYIKGRTIAEMFGDYAAFGIEFDEKSVNGGLGNIYFNGKLVKQFIDLQPDGGVFSCSSSDGGEITVRMVYDENGRLTGAEIIKD